jgi:hypothetical protein
MATDTKSLKILRSIYELDKNKKERDKITKEMMVVKSWKMFPSDFSMKGYPQYPNADISKYITALFRTNFLKGGFHNYKITEKGKKFIEEEKIKKQPKKSIDKTKIPRYIEFEINRILASKVFEYFSGGKEDFLETDLFEFLGTSARSFKDNNQSNFLSRYNLVAKEVIPFCQKNKNLDSRLEGIVNLWKSLQNKFSSLLKK